MKRIIVFALCTITHLSIAQINKDLDADGIKDEVSLDEANMRIVCKLSTQNFKPIYSKSELTDEMSSGISETKNGFEFHVGFMRAGYAYQFRYEKKDKKVRLIGMSRYEFGPASNDGSGESSINLLTNDYIGEWNHFDLEKNELIKMPTIKAKMYFPKIYLENFDGYPMGIYSEKCSKLYYQAKKKYQ